jgi:hypothetical protein
MGKSPGDHVSFVDVFFAEIEDLRRRDRKSRRQPERLQSAFGGDVVAANDGDRFTLGAD